MQKDDTIHIVNWCCVDSFGIFTKANQYKDSKMKKFLIAAIIMWAPVSSASEMEVTEEYCKWITTIARDIAFERVSGHLLSDMLSESETEVERAIVMDSFAEIKSAYSSPEIVSRKVSNFANKWSFACFSQIK